MRILASVALGALLLGACGGTQQVYEVPPGGSSAVDLGDLTLPEPISAVPVFVVDAGKAISSSKLKDLRRTRGAAVVATASVKTLVAKGSKGTERIRAAAIDPLEFRPVSPVPTRDADFVWLALLTGEAVLSHEAAAKLGLKSATEVGLKNGSRLDVGAVADNGTPNFADVIVDADTVAKDWGPRRLAIVGAKTGVTLESLRDALKRKLPGGHIKRIIAQAQIVTPLPQVAAPAATSTSTAGFHPAMADAVNQLLNAAGGRVWIVSGFRSTSRQYELWVQALQKYGDPEVANNWVAPPGHSNHERGLAVDLGGDLEYAASLVQELGIPLWRPMSWEPWHFEIVGSRG